MILRLHRQYRPSRIETPSNTGGVNKEFREKQHLRQRERERGVYASSKSRSENGQERASRDRDTGIVFTCFHITFHLIIRQLF